MSNALRGFAQGLGKAMVSIGSSRMETERAERLQKIRDQGRIAAESRAESKRVAALAESRQYQEQQRAEERQHQAAAKQEERTYQKTQIQEQEIRRNQEKRNFETWKQNNVQASPKSTKYDDDGNITIIYDNGAIVKIDREGRRQYMEPTTAENVVEQNAVIDADRRAAEQETLDQTYAEDIYNDLNTEGIDLFGIIDKVEDPKDVAVAKIKDIIRNNREANREQIKSTYKHFAEFPIEQSQDVPTQIPQQKPVKPQRVTRVQEELGKLISAQDSKEKQIQVLQAVLRSDKYQGAHADAKKLLQRLQQKTEQ